MACLPPVFFLYTYKKRLYFCIETHAVPYSLIVSSWLMSTATPPKSRKDCLLVILSVLIHCKNIPLQIATNVVEFVIIENSVPSLMFCVYNDRCPKIVEYIISRKINFALINLSPTLSDCTQHTEPVVLEFSLLSEIRI